MNSSSKRAGVEETADNASWVAGEVAGCEFRDARLGKRLGSLLHRLGGSIGGTIPFACQDWANAKAAYRFLSNDDVDEHAILAGHFQATRDRAQATSGPLLILQDTTEFSYKRNEPEKIGFTAKTNTGKDGRSLTARLQERSLLQRVRERARRELELELEAVACRVNADPEPPLSDGEDEDLVVNAHAARRLGAICAEHPNEEA